MKIVQLTTTSKTPKQISKMPNNLLVSYMIKSRSLPLHLLFICSLIFNNLQQSHSHPKTHKNQDNEQQQQQHQQTILSNDILTGFELDNSNVQLKDEQLQIMDSNMQQMQENMREFAGSMMQQRQLTDTQFAHSNAQPRLQETSQTSNCISNRDELDKCSAQLIAFGSSKATYPHDMNELNNVYCPRVKKLLSCIKDSSSCFSRFDRQVIE